MADDQPAVASQAGIQLGRYTVLKPLVSGGITEVLLARASGSAGFSHHVVIKCIRANKSTDPRFVEMFLDEARLAASLHHHHIVQVHDVGREANDYFFAMEYVHGENLRRLLTHVARSRELIPLDQVITIGMAVASALHYAHQQSIVHRDVTPANILVGYDGNVKVVDFGIAKAMLSSSEMTKSGTMRGKVAYMAPEQCLGRPIDHRSDIFSLGIVLYELCTSRRLFKGDTDFLVMTSIVNGKIPKPTQFRSDLPIELQDVILKALAPSPQLRFENAEELALALERVAVAGGFRISSSALAEYLRMIFGSRPEPWLVDSALVVDDVDFDGGGIGLVEIDDASNPTIEHELLGSPLLAANTGDANEFAEDPRTEIQDPDDEDPPTLSGGDPRTAEAEARRLLAAAPQSGFEGNERTMIGEQEDVDMLVGLSKIEGRVVAARVPVPVAAPPRGEPTPIPRAATPAPAPPEVQPPQPRTPSSWGNPDGSGHISVTGTPMAWISNDSDVPSLAPKGRRAMLIAAVAVPLVVIGIIVMTRGGSGDEGTGAAGSVEPDAFVESVDALALTTPDATPPDAPGVTAGSAAAGSATTPRPAVAKPVVKKPTPKKPTPKKPMTKRPPLKR